MNISKYSISCCMGSSRDWTHLEFLNKTDIDNLNSIGYSGKNILGKKQSRKEYLSNTYPNKIFDITQTKFDDGSFMEEFLVIVIDKKEKSKV